ncbi:MAG: P-loop NTPase [Gemmobacter sp.]
MPQDDPPTLDAARAVLAGIGLPDGGTLADADRLTALAMRDRRLNVAIAIRPEEASAFGPLRSRAEAALQGLPGVEEALVVLTAERPAAANREPGRPPAAQRLLPGVAQVVAVASGKGGVGKSTTTVNLALALRARGLRVGILDADVHGPSLPTLLGLRGRPRIGPDRRLRPSEAFGLAAMSMGLLVDEETAMIWRGPMVMSALMQMLAEVDWGTLDLLLIDMPPGTGDAQLAIAQSVKLSGAVIVSTPQDLALIDARRGIAMFGKVGVPVLGVIENMAHFVCTTCGARHEIFGAGGAEAEAARLGVPFLGAVPLTMALRQGSDSGRPPVALDPDGVLGSTYGRIAQALRDRLADRHPASEASAAGEEAERRPVE